MRTGGSRNLLSEREMGRDGRNFNSPLEVLRCVAVKLDGVPSFDLLCTNSFIFTLSGAVGEQLHSGESPPIRGNTSGMKEERRR